MATIYYKSIRCPHTEDIGGTTDCDFEINKVHFETHVDELTGETYEAMVKDSQLEFVSRFQMAIQPVDRKDGVLNEAMRTYINSINKDNYEVVDIWKP